MPCTGQSLERWWAGWPTSPPSLLCPHLHQFYSVCPSQSAARKWSSQVGLQGAAEDKVRGNCDIRGLLKAFPMRYCWYYSFKYIPECKYAHIYTSLMNTRLNMTERKHQCDNKGLINLPSLHYSTFIWLHSADYLPCGLSKHLTVFS